MTSNFSIELCSENDGSFNKLLDHARTLTPYGTAFRYPDIVLEPDKGDVLDAIEKASDVLSFVRNLLHE
jgi:hypothetical protein